MTSVVLPIIKKDLEEKYGFNLEDLIIYEAC